MSEMRMTWTEERVALLKARVDAGLTCAQIAREIGVSRNAVIGKVSRLGLSRVVVVQPTAYGRDNRCTLAAIAEFGNDARGIAVVDETVTDAELESLTRAGIRGVRDQLAQEDIAVRIDRMHHQMEQPRDVSLEGPGFRRHAIRRHLGS